MFSEPLLDGLWGAWAARRGVIATVERVLDDVEGLGHRVRIPAHRVLAVVEAPYGAHPGGCYAPGLPVRSYGEDIAHWSAAADAAARDDFDRYVEEWVLGPKTHEEYLARVGRRAAAVAGRAFRPDVVEGRRGRHADRRGPEVTKWETAASLGAREVERVVEMVGADAVLAGAGVANLSAWVAVARARAAGQQRRAHGRARVVGLPADARPIPTSSISGCFPSTPYLSDASSVLGMVIGGPGTTTVGCLGAAEVDANGCLNSTELEGGASWSALAAPTTWPAGPRPASSSRWPARNGCPRPWRTSRRPASAWPAS